MIARHHDLRPGETAEKTGGLAKLGGTGTLREIAARHQHVRRAECKLLRQCLCQLRIDSAEMNVGDMRDRSQAVGELPVVIRNVRAGRPVSG